jgi:hypothetical protein
MSLQGYALQTEADTEIVSAYAASLQNVPAVTVAPGWFKVGAFYLPKALACRLDVIAFVSSAGLVGTARLYDPVANAPVAGSDVTFSGLTDARALSSQVQLAGDQIYLILCQCVGATGVTKFAVVNTASLVGI